MELDTCLGNDDGRSTLCKFAYYYMSRKGQFDHQNTLESFARDCCQTEFYLLPGADKIELLPLKNACVFNL